MAKVATFSKLKSLLKCYFLKFGHTTTATTTTTTNIGGSYTADSFDKTLSSNSALGFETVYVGKYRRAYQISSNLIKHPSFKGIINTSIIDGSDDNTITVTCEVVLFEHLLWMLQNIDPQTESLDDLVALYD